MYSNKRQLQSVSPDPPYYAFRFQYNVYYPAVVLNQTILIPAVYTQKNCLYNLTDIDKMPFRWTKVDIPVRHTGINDQIKIKLISTVPIAINNFKIIIKE